MKKINLHKIAYEIENFIFIYLFICLFIYLFLHLAACGILVPQPGIKPVSPALGAQSLNHWTAREVPVMAKFKKNMYRTA